MKRALIGALGLLLAASPAGAQRLTDQERRELETKLEQLRREMRDVERQLGRPGGVLFRTPDMQQATWAYSLFMGRPRIGVTVNTENDAATDSIGAAIEAVTPDGPAAKAGLQGGDIIVRFNNESLGRRGDSETSPGDRLIELAQELEEGDTVRVQYRRGRETRNATIVARKLDDQPFAYTFRRDSLLRGELVGDLAERMRDQARVYEGLRMRVEPGTTFLFAGQRWSDMELTTIDAELGSYFGTTEGLLVVKAPKDSFLSLKGGDVILRIGGRVPTSPSHAVRILRSYEPGDEVVVQIMRNKNRTEVRGTVPEREREERNEQF
jgi:C-terminal processing protease CtpA/Prc